MTTSLETLKALNLTKNSQNNKIANHYLNLVKLVKELKNDITAVEVLEFEKIEHYCYDRWNNRVNGEDHYKVFNSEFLKTIQIKTTFGVYNITAPTDTNYYSYLCVLLNIESSYKKETQTFENSIYIDSLINESILKAAKFTNLNSYNEITKNVILKFENNFVEVLSTTGHVLFKSQKFNFVSDQKIDNLFLSIPVAEVVAFKGAKNEFLQIDIINNETIFVNNNVIKLALNDCTAINTFSFEVNEIMEFKRLELSKNIKSLKNMLSYTKQIKFHLNGCIDIQTINVDAGIKTNLKSDYISKNFNDSDYIFGFNDIFNSLSSFKSETLLFSPITNNNKSMAVITDKVDSFLIINQLQKV
jgi:hypothetical protein